MMKIWVLIFSLLAFGAKGAVEKIPTPEDTKLTKEITKGFKTSEDVNVLITNKYGQVIVHTWAKDSVSVSVTVEVEGKNESEAAKQMDRIHVEMSQSMNQVSLETVFDQSSQFFKDLWNSVSEMSSAVSSKGKVSINYEFFVPEKANLDIVHKFGNVVVDGLRGKLKVDLNHGDFTTGDLANFANISLGFGRAKINSVDIAMINLKGATLLLAQANQLELNAASSEIELGTVENLKLASRNDVFKIARVNSFIGRSQFTDMNVKQLVGNIDVNLFYGGIFVEHVEMNFRQLQLTSKSAQVRVDFDVAATFTYKLSGRDDRIYLPAEFSDLQKRADFQNEKNVLLTGEYGYNEPKSTVDIKAENADLTIKLAPTLPYSSFKK